jgi:iron(II)-dependent oxidoreductase
MSSFNYYWLNKFPGGLYLIVALLFLGSGGFADDDPQTEVNEKPSGMVLILGGEFMMGKEGEDDFSPAHSVYVDSFYMDKYEVTNARYIDFCAATERKMPGFWEVEEFHSGPEFLDFPVIGVSWSDARAYAEWCGKRLPTEAEWEYAARGGLVGLKYAWGDEIDSSKANYTIDGKTIGPKPVGSYPPNQFGLYDMTGNVNEWVLDTYGRDYYGASPDDNPQGPEGGRLRVIRGGGWHTGPYCCQVHFRNCLPANWLDINVGFRCVKDVTTEAPETSPE